MRSDHFLFPFFFSIVRATRTFVGLLLLEVLNKFAPNLVEGCTIIFLRIKIKTKRNNLYFTFFGLHDDVPSFALILGECSPYPYTYSRWKPYLDRVNQML